MGAIQQADLAGIVRIVLPVPEAGSVQSTHIRPVGTQRLLRSNLDAAGAATGMEQRQVSGGREAEAVVGYLHFQVDFPVGRKRRRPESATEVLRVVQVDG